MEDKSLPEPTGGDLLPPPFLTPEQDDLCKRLDQLYEQYDLKVNPSDMYRGAIFASRPECRSNPDWIAQAANSLREILYPFWSPQVKVIPEKKGDALKKYGSVLISDAFIQEVGRMYGQLNDLAHHGSGSTNSDFSNFSITDFEVLLKKFEKVMQEALTRQIDVHKEIDQILNYEPTQIMSENATT